MARQFSRAAALYGSRRGRVGHDGDLPGLWTELRDRYPPLRELGSVARAYLLCFCQVAELVKLSAHDIHGLDENEIMRLEQSKSESDH